jgi:hypothetical protein
VDFQQWNDGQTMYSQCPAPATSCLAGKDSAVSSAAEVTVEIMVLKLVWLYPCSLLHNSAILLPGRELELPMDYI